MWYDQSWTDYGDWSYSKPSAQHLVLPPTHTAQTVQALATASGTVSTVTGFPNISALVSSSTSGTLQTVSAVSTICSNVLVPELEVWEELLFSTIAALSLGTSEGTSMHSVPVHFALGNVTVKTDLVTNWPGCMTTVLHLYLLRETGFYLIQEQGALLPIWLCFRLSTSTVGSQSTKLEKRNWEGRREVH